MLLFITKHINGPSLKRFTTKIGYLFIALSLVTVSAYASDREALFGDWGTSAQCARELITPKGTKHAAPFVINSEWLRHGDSWCYLNWGTVAPSSDGLFAVAQAQCGEDAVRGYTINFRLNGEELNLSWDLWHKVGPLMRCPG